MLLRTSIVVISILVLATAGVTAESEPTFSSIQKAAEQGDASAQFNYGLLYHFGSGVLQDYTEARKWYLKAAEQGHAKAQSNLGVLYHNAQGVPQDYAEAAKWYLKAAEQGLPQAQLFLGVLYHNGQGVQMDYKLAYAWGHAAAEGGNEEAKGLRDAAAAELDPASLAEAQKLAEQYHKSYVEPFQ
jgi:TPR repeat protein